jgi:hypothetical protein
VQGLLNHVIHIYNIRRSVSVPSTEQLSKGKAKHGAG